MNISLEEYWQKSIALKHSAYPGNPRRIVGSYGELINPSLLWLERLMSESSISLDAHARAITKIASVLDQLQVTNKQFGLSATESQESTLWEQCSDRGYSMDKNIFLRATSSYYFTLSSEAIDRDFPTVEMQTEASLFGDGRARIPVKKITYEGVPLLIDDEFDYFLDRTKARIFESIGYGVVDYFYKRSLGFWRELFAFTPAGERNRSEGYVEHDVSGPLYRKSIESLFIEFAHSEGVAGDDIRDFRNFVGALDPDHDFGDWLLRGNPEFDVDNLFQEILKKIGTQFDYFVQDNEQELERRILGYYRDGLKP